MEEKIYQVVLETQSTVLQTQKDLLQLQKDLQQTEKKLEGKITNVSKRLQDQINELDKREEKRYLMLQNDIGAAYTAIESLGKEIKKMDQRKVDKEALRNIS